MALFEETLELWDSFKEWKAKPWDPWESDPSLVEELELELEHELLLLKKIKSWKAKIGLWNKC